MDPGPYTLRQLVWMAAGAWDPASHLLAMMANVNRDPKKAGVFRAYQFNPYKTRSLMRLPVGAARGLFGKNLEEKTISASAKG